MTTPRQLRRVLVRRYRRAWKAFKAIDDAWPMSRAVPPAKWDDALQDFHAAKDALSNHDRARKETPCR